MAITGEGIARDGPQGLICVYALMDPGKGLSFSRAFLILSLFGIVGTTLSLVINSVFHGNERWGCNESGLVSDELVNFTEFLELQDLPPSWILFYFIH